MSVAPALLVLAAGMSTRYGGVPKQTDAMGPNGETLLDYSVYDAIRAGFGRVVFVVRREGEADFRDRVVRRLEPHIAVATVCQELDDLPEGFRLPEGRRKPWGTGHAVWAARRTIREPFCVINADDYYGRDSLQAIAAFLSRPELPAHPRRYAMVGYPLRQTLSEHGRVARGLCRVDPDGMLQGIEELTHIFPAGAGAENRPPGGDPRPLTGSEIVSLNLWGFTPVVFGQFGECFAEFLDSGGLLNPESEFYIPAALDVLLNRNEAVCEVIPTSSRWFGVTFQDDKPRVQAALQTMISAGLYPADLWG